VRATQFMRLARVQGCVNPAEHDVCAAIASYFANLVTAKCVRRMDADANNISRLNVERIQGFQSFIDQAGIAKASGGRGRQNVEPARGYDSGTERNLAWINEMNMHSIAPSLGGLA